MTIQVWTVEGWVHKKISKGVEATFVLLPYNHMEVE